ncbi:GalNAc-alpha-(1-_4)-GalNAc-alpha-(1-_3)-diNAcBac-PP-undecaprenol alpha-1,4-N-acetyl-D-galactosaminyltransferase [Roseimaritima ulvae]|uniref:GalNAc-alpha-(1->4)-GalNAc-alpha-(1->3)-diNAcBac-PP-undecaprenol alpha-1,4-N-acetyl-D-galactosaminyltransferase n=2 Tax=Roseimaritima ulvae TaxID=980254 RepID=A0A5B9R6X3_9BACT|nr:GalNAc-alpha-(1->4)-GalNAc-alpha-(1->3)-diNAcBac-PP-undecaprenol alpha-1,4-N-acetyl-D-galactosaminyltransferase [Roseimaritima ulvae]
MAGLTGRLAARGHQVRLVTLDDGRHDRHSVAPAVERVCLDVMADSSGKWAAIRNNRARLASLRAAIGAYSPQVILSFCDSTNVLTLLAAAGLGIPVVVSERSDPAQHPMSPLWSRLRRWTYRRAARLVALSDTSARTMAAWNRRPVAVIPSAVEVPEPNDGDAAAGRERASHPGKTILGVGRLADEKGFDRLIDAFVQLADEFPDWRLAIAGEGPQRSRLEAQIAASDCAQRIELLGWQRPITPLYRTADLFVLPSRYEGFPSALLEAMACGVASLGIDCESGPREIIRDGVDGMLTSPAALATDMRRLMQDDTRRQQLGRRAVEVVERFGWDAMVERYLQVLREAV